MAKKNKTVTAPVEETSAPEAEATNALGHVNFTKEELIAAYKVINQEGGASKQETLDAINEAGGNDRNLQSATTARLKLSKALKAQGKKLPSFKRTAGSGPRASVMDDLFADFDLDELPDIATDAEPEVEAEVELD